jgi:hypothetical protein
MPMVVDFVDLDELGVELRNVRRVALIVVEHKLDRTPQQPALGIDVIAPDLQRGEHLLADRRDAAGERHGHADPDRVGGHRHGRQDQRSNEKGCDAAGSIPKHPDAHVLYSSQRARLAACFRPLDQFFDRVLLSGRPTGPGQDMVPF